MICPRCKTELREVWLDDVVLDRCERGGGIWFDFAELERVLSRETHALRKLLPKKECQGDMRAEVLPCPRCGDTLIRMRAAVEGMTFYTCLTCYGRWLDGSELKRIIGSPLAVKFEKLFQELLD